MQHVLPITKTTAKALISYDLDKSNVQWHRQPHIHRLPMTQSTAYTIAYALITNYMTTPFALFNNNIDKAYAPTNNDIVKAYSLITNDIDNSKGTFYQWYIQQHMHLLPIGMNKSICTYYQWHIQQHMLLLEWYRQVQ